MIPYGRQDITQADIDAVVEVLKSDFLTQGPTVPRFENIVAEHVGAKYAVAVNSATSALHISCLALGLGRSDWLWTSPITFVASANCGLYCGAKVDFVDIDPLTNNISVSALQKKLETAEKIGTLPKIIVPVHLGGQSCEMDSIHALSKRYGFKIIEDASHAIGGRYREQYVGSCQYSDITVFSFHPVKIVTTAEGGLASTNDEALAEKMALLRSHGITRNPRLMTHEPDGDWYYQQIELGFNYRMTELQAALGISQMMKLEKYIEQRRNLARRYDVLLQDLPVTRPILRDVIQSALHLYIIRLNLDKIGTSRREVFDILRGKGVGANVHYIPVYAQPYYQRMGYEPGEYPEAERYYNEAISLPLFPALTEHQVEMVVCALTGALL